MTDKKFIRELMYLLHNVMYPEDFKDAKTGEVIVDARIRRRWAMEELKSDVDTYFKKHKYRK